MVIFSDLSILGCLDFIAISVDLCLLDEIQDYFGQFMNKESYNLHYKYSSTIIYFILLWKLK